MSDILSHHCPHVSRSSAGDGGGADGHRAAQLGEAGQPPGQPQGLDTVGHGLTAKARRAAGRARNHETPETLAKLSVQTSRRVHPALRRTLETNPRTKLRAFPRRTAKRSGVSPGRLATVSDSEKRRGAQVLPLAGQYRIGANQPFQVPLCASPRRRYGLSILSV